MLKYKKNFTSAKRISSHYKNLSKYRINFINFAIVQNKNMLCIRSNSANPWFNLASEEYLLKESGEDIFMLWQSEPSVVVGKHQNTLAEINYNYIRRNNIKVARRLSGGGTVYHDRGNLNFTFILNGIEGRLINFYRYMEPVLKVLQGLCVDARFEGRNNMMINSMKISGNAEHIYKKRILHHGTLLFNTDIDKLAESLKVTPGRYTDKAVQSIRSAVTNIRNYLQQDIDILQFRDILFNHIFENNHDSMIYELSRKDEDRINALVGSKYSTWEWIYGYSPKYSLNGIYRTGRREVQFTIFVETGIIREMEVKGAGINDKKISDLSNLFRGLVHRESDLMKKAGMISELLLISEAEACEFINSMF
jgi:lipoate-protein ligase A